MRPRRRGGTRNQQASASPGVTKAVRVVTAKEHTCAMRNDTPALVCWGDNRYRPARADAHGARRLRRPGPDRRPEAGAPLAVGPSFEDVCAIFGDRGEVYCWGFNRRGQRGNGTKGTAFDAIPTAVLADAPIKQPPLMGAIEIFETQGLDRCVRSLLPEYGHPFLCWGGNDRGELGLGTLDTRGEEIVFAKPALAIPKDTFSLSLGDDHGCLIAGPSQGPFTVACFGEEAYLGSSDAPDPTGAHPLPVKVRFPRR